MSLMELNVHFLALMGNTFQAPLVQHAPKNARAVFQMKSVFHVLLPTICLLGLAEKNAHLEQLSLENNVLLVNLLALHVLAQQAHVIHVRQAIFYSMGNAWKIAQLQHITQPQAAWLVVQDA